MKNKTIHNTIGTLKGILTVMLIPAAIALFIGFAFFIAWLGWPAVLGACFSIIVLAGHQTAKNNGWLKE